MDFDLSDDMAAVLDAMRPLLAKYARLPSPGQSDYYVPGTELDADLEEAGFFANAGDAGFGPEEAALIVEHVCRSPYVVEAAASILVVPQITAELLPRPIALVQAASRAPVRFLGLARTAIIDTGKDVRVLDLRGVEVVKVDNLFAYPFGRIEALDWTAARVLPEVTPDRLRHWWRLALSAECLGAIRSALDLTVDYVKQRQQFGRPIGSFQAVQHRLAAAAVVADGLELLVRRAAWSRDPADAALAASYAQDMSAQLIYDFHQFHGAIGLTLQYVLHHWTYRLKILVGEIGGASAQARHAAQLVWDGRGRERPIRERA
jgi:alkylation response protein AidB-like acyl-CoA dehydrogenase